MHYTFLLRHVHYQKSCYLKFFFADNVIDVITYKAQPYDSSSFNSWTPLKELLDKSSLSLSSFNSLMHLRNVSVVGSMSIWRQPRALTSLLGRRRISDEHRIVSHFEQQSWTLSPKELVSFLFSVSLDRYDCSLIVFLHLLNHMQLIHSNRSDSKRF